MTARGGGGVGGKGGQGMGGDLIVFVGPGVVHLTYLLLPGEGYLNLSSPGMEIFDCRLGRKRLRPNTLPCFTHVPYGVERSGDHEGQREQAKAGWISLFCLQISFVLACF